MSKKLKVILIISAVLVFVLAAYVGAGFFTAEITFEEPDEKEQIEVFSDYNVTSLSATVRFPLFFGAASKLAVACEGNVKADKLGDNVITYRAKFLNKTAEISQTVSVVDTVAPTITVDEDFFEINADAIPVDPAKVTVAATATDNYDGDITDKIVKTVEGDVCYYTATDSSGNSVKVKINLLYQDDKGPELKLKGNSTVYMPINTAYKELGYTVKDNLDKDIASKVKITSNLNVNKRGTYAVTYSVSDAAGNKSSLTRRVIVYGGDYSGEYNSVKPNGKVIYLTFDDGPSIYTETLLATLKRYNVKATFFVTNQKPKFQYLIGQMHREGHTVALHTLTHKWEIYKSVDAYLADFNAMNAIIEEQTGSPTRIFRFPGGTNNTVSKSHSKGIMTTLSKTMLESGYTYFDWNVSSSDTYYTDSSDIINTLVNQVSKRSSSVILAHDIKSATVNAMPGFIEYCLKNGYTFKAITEDTEPVRFKPKN